MPETTTKPATQDFHWVMTVQTQDGRVNTREAVITAPVGFTSSDAFKFVIDQFKADFGSVVVLFYALTPNKL
jgi:hypothetical protein